MKKADQPTAPPERPAGDFQTAPLTSGAMRTQGARVTRLCKICGQPIHPQRLAVSPRTVTCSARHSAENLRRLRNDANRRWQQKKRDQRKAGVVPA